MVWEGWLCGQYPGNVSSLLMGAMSAHVSLPSETTGSVTVPRGSQDLKPFAVSTTVSAFKCSNCAPAAQQIGEQLNTLLPNFNPFFFASA